MIEVTCGCGVTKTLTERNVAKSLRKHGVWRCLKCAMKTHMAPKALTTEQFVANARKVHGDRYDYSETVYKVSRAKVRVICPDHGPFYQRAISHARSTAETSCGCPICAKNELEARLRDRWNQPGFREKLDAIQSSPEYKTKVVANWNDPEKAAAMREQRSHLTAGFWKRDGFRRKIAAFKQPVISSLSRRAAALLEEWGVWYELEHVVDYYSFDIHVPSRNLLIELQGEYWHSKPEAIANDRRKATYVRNHYPNLKLVVIWEKEFGRNGRLREILAEAVGVDP